MSQSPTNAPWYAAGLAFECMQCGRCCAGPDEGYVWVTDEEIAAIAETIGVSQSQMRSQYVRKVGNRQTLVEQSGSHDCVFLSPAADRYDRGCRIYHVRPAQCRTWPFWTANLAGPANWSRAGCRCAGINRGKQFTYDEIQSRLHGTP